MQEIDRRLSQLATILAWADAPQRNGVERDYVKAHRSAWIYERTKLRDMKDAHEEALAEGLS